MLGLFRFCNLLVRQRILINRVFGIPKRLLFVVMTVVVLGEYTHVRRQRKAIYLHLSGQLHLFVAGIPAILLLQIRIPRLVAEI